MPSPHISGTLGVGVKLASTPQTISNKNYDQYMAGTIFNGVYYATRSSSGVSGGLTYFGPTASGVSSVVTLAVQPSGLPVNLSNVPIGFLTGTKDPSQGGSGLSPVVGNGQNSFSNTVLGSHLPRAFVFTDNTTVRTLWQTDANYGLMSIPQCTFPGTFGVGILCSGNTSSAPLGPYGFPFGSYSTRPPGTLPKNAGVMGVAAVMVGGVQMVAVTQQTAMWLWPTANTGPYNNSAGNCCDPSVNGGAGTCCWANNNQPVLPRAGYEFRYVAPVPSPPACTLPGYSCSGTTPVPCPKGRFCAGGGAPPTPCPIGSYSEQPGNAICWACDNPTFTTVSLGASSWTDCVPTCTSSGYYCPVSTPVACPPGYVCPGGVAYYSLCPAGTWSAASAVTCTGCPAGFTTNGPGKTSSSACVTCPANFIPKLLPVGSTAQGCEACPAGTIARPGEIRCSSASTQAVFTPGNLLIFLAGDGSVSGSPAPTYFNFTGTSLDNTLRQLQNGLLSLPYPQAFDRNSINSVTGKVAEFSIGAGGGLTATGKAAALPASPAPWSSSALSMGPVSVLGSLADIGNSNQIAGGVAGNMVYQVCARAHACIVCGKLRSCLTVSRPASRSPFPPSSRPPRTKRSSALPATRWRRTCPWAGQVWPGFTGARPA